MNLREFYSANVAFKDFGSVYNNFVLFYGNTGGERFVTNITRGWFIVASFLMRLQDLLGLKQDG